MDDCALFEFGNRVTLCDSNLTRREDETLQADYLKQPKKTNLLMD